MIEISVITPAYNAEETLARTLDSLLAQTYPYWECIVVDDGSVDGTLPLAEGYGLRDGRIKPVQLMSNVGLSAARNNGIGFASHDWLSFLDADDTYDPGHFGAMVVPLEKDPSLDGVWCNYRLVCMDGTVWEVGEFRPLELVEGGVDFFEASTHLCPIHVSAIVVKKALVEAVGGFKAGFIGAEDQLLWQRLGRMGIKLGYVSKSFVNYHLRHGSICRQQFVECFEGGLEVLKLGYAADPVVPNSLPQYREGLTGVAYPLSTLFYLAAVAMVGLLVSGEDVDDFILRVSKEVTTGYFWDGRVTVRDILWDVNYIPLSATCLPFEWNKETWAMWGPLVETFLDWAGDFLGRWDDELVPEVRRILKEKME